MTTHRATTYGDLVNGDHVWVEGHLFEVRNFRIESGYMPIHEGYGPGVPVVRFEGHCVNPADDIAGTGYDGGTYGGILARPACVEVNGADPTADAPAVPYVLRGGARVYLR